MPVSSFFTWKGWIFISFWCVNMYSSYSFTIFNLLVPSVLIHFFDFLLFSKFKKYLWFFQNQFFQIFFGYFTLVRSGYESVSLFLLCTSVDFTHPQQCIWQLIQKRAQFDWLEVRAMTHPTKEKPVDVNNPNRDESDTFYAYFLWLRKNLDRFHVKINPEISRNLTKWVKYVFERKT